MTFMRGPHHCLGTARTITELIIRHLEACAEERGGQLTIAELKAAHLQFVDQLSTIYLRQIEDIHAGCMEASGSPVVSPVSRGQILSSVLYMSTHAIGRRAFRNAHDRGGPDSLMLIYDGFAHFLRTSFCPGVDDTLFGIYAKVATVVGPRFALPQLVQERDVQLLLRQCLAALVTPGAAAAHARALAGSINEFVSNLSGTTESAECPVAHSEAEHFLRELRIVICGLETAEGERRTPVRSSVSQDIEWVESAGPVSPTRKA